MEYYYKHEEFGTVRIVSVDNSVWFVGKDITDILGYSRGRDIIAKCVKPKDKRYKQINSSKYGYRKMIIVNAYGLNSLINTKMPEVKRFKEWLFKNVFLDAQQKIEHMLNHKPISKPEMPNKQMDIMSDFFSEISSDAKSFLFSEAAQILSRQKSELQKLNANISFANQQIAALNHQNEQQSILLKKKEQEIAALREKINSLEKKTHHFNPEKLRKLISSLVSRYAVKAKNSEWKLAWDDLKEAVKSDENGPHIDIDSRIWASKRAENKKATAVNVLNDWELQSVIDVACRMCQKNNVYFKDLIN